MSEQLKRGCGCHNKVTIQPKVKTMNQNETKTSKPQEAVGTESYTNSLGCAKCYAKHLAKAVVQWSEFREDASRLAELSLCIGNIGCAEDHAAALGREGERARLRNVRVLIYDAPHAVAGELQEIAAEAMRMSILASEADKRERAERAAASRSSANPATK